MEGPVTAPNPRKRWWRRLFSLAPRGQVRVEAVAAPWPAEAPPAAHLPPATSASAATAPDPLPLNREQPHRKPFYMRSSWTWPQFDPACCQECARVIPLTETGWIVEQTQVVCAECHAIIEARRLSQQEFMRSQPSASSEAAVPLTGALPPTSAPPPNPAEPLPASSTAAPIADRSETSASLPTEPSAIQPPASPIAASAATWAPPADERNAEVNSQPAIFAPPPQVGVQHAILSAWSLRVGTMVQASPLRLSSAHRHVPTPPIPERKSRPESAPVIAPEPHPALEPPPVPAPAPEIVPESAAEAEPVAAPEPAAVTEPVPLLESVVLPEPVVAQELAVAPEPVAMPEPVLPPELTLAQEPVVAPEPAAVTEPVPMPESVVLSEPVVAQELAVAAEPVAVPEPVVAPELVAASEAVLATEAQAFAQTQAQAQAPADTQAIAEAQTLAEAQTSAEAQPSAQAQSAETVTQPLHQARKRRRRARVSQTDTVEAFLDAMARQPVPTLVYDAMRKSARLDTPTEEVEQMLTAADELTARWLRLNDAPAAGAA